MLICPYDSRLSVCIGVAVIRRTRTRIVHREQIRTIFNSPIFGNSVALRTLGFENLCSLFGVSCWDFDVRFGSNCEGNGQLWTLGDQCAAYPTWHCYRGCKNVDASVLALNEKSAINACVFGLGLIPRSCCDDARPYSISCICLKQLYFSCGRSCVFGSTLLNLASPRPLVSVGHVNSHLVVVVQRPQRSEWEEFSHEQPATG